MRGDAEARLPVVDYPLFRRRLEDGSLGDLVAASEWIELKPLKSERLPPAPPADDVGLISGAAPVADGRGPKRAGRQDTTYFPHISGRFAPRPPPEGAGYVVSRHPRREIEETGEVEIPYTVEGPRAWDASQLRIMYRRALNILHQVGLPLRADEVWLYRSDGKWRALPDRAGGTLEPVELKGAWRLPEQARAATPRPYPVEFIRDFGGEYGPLEWAFLVIDSVRRISREDRRRRHGARLARVLPYLLEWMELERSVNSDGDPNLVGALSIVRETIDWKALNIADPAFVAGFTLGQRLGVFSVVDGVKAADPARLGAQKKARQADNWRGPALDLAIKLRAQHPNYGQKALADCLIEQLSGCPERDQVIATIRSWEKSGKLKPSTHKPNG